MSGEALVQLASDLHLDVRNSPDVISPNAPTLILAGDVCSVANPRYRDFMDVVTRSHRQVAYVAGNHEFYEAGAPLSAALDAIERVCRSLNTRVALLRAGGDHLDVPGTDCRIVGATLWTDVHPGVAGAVESMLNDFKYVRDDDGRALTARSMSSLHSVDRRWISRSIKQARRDGFRAVVATHHSPDRRLSVNNRGRSCNGLGPLYYASDMDSVIADDNIAAWCYGHTHESHVMKLLGAPFPFVTNALGYPHERTGYGDGAGLKLG